MQFFLQTKKFNKNYLITTSKFEYESAFDFILELFSKHHFVDRETELYLYGLLEKSGYSTIEQIPLLQLNTILDYFLKNRNQYKVNYDEERLSYLLLAAIQAKKIIFTIDKRTVDDLRDRIILHENSTISFLNLKKLDNIKFKSF